MLRIDEAQGDGATVLRVEGRLTGQWVAELARATESANVRVSQVTLDLSGLSFADQSGTALLSSLASRGVRLVNCSPFASAQLRDAHVRCGVE